MKLLIAIPTLDYVRVEFVKALTKLIKRLHDDQINFDVEFCSGTLVYIARDRLAAKAIEGNYTNVLWLDSDMVFDDELLYDLQFSRKDFISGICRSRRFPYVSCVFSSLDPIERIDEIPRDTFRIAGCGMACVLIKTSILRAVWQKYGSCFVPTAALGEDLAFCQRAAETGFDIYAEPAAQLGHIGNIVIYPHDAERLSQINRMGDD